MVKEDDFAEQFADETAEPAAGAPASNVRLPQLPLWALFIAAASAVGSVKFAVGSV